MAGARIVESLVLGSARSCGADDAARTAVAPKFRRHALRQRSALQIPRVACDLQGDPAPRQLPVQPSLRRPAAARRRIFGRLRRTRRRSAAAMARRGGSARSERFADGICSLHPYRRRRFRQRRAGRRDIDRRATGTGRNLQLPRHGDQRRRHGCPNRRGACWWSTASTA